MKMHYLNEDVKLEKLPIIYSDELKTKIEDVIFHNKFEKEILDHWLNELEGMTNWVANRIIAWDNQNKFVHYDDGEIYIKQYGILFKILTNKDDQGVEHNFVCILRMPLNLQNYNLRIPPYLYENKNSQTTRMLYKNNHKDVIKINELHIRQIVRETLRRYLQL